MTDVKWKRRVSGTPNQIGRAFPIPDTSTLPKITYEEASPRGSLTQLMEEKKRKQELLDERLEELEREARRLEMKQFLELSNEKEQAESDAEVLQNIIMERVREFRENLKYRKVDTLVERARSDNPLLRESALLKLRTLDRELYDNIREENKLVDLINRINKQQETS